jgi:hypothetical protein
LNSLNQGVDIIFQKRGPLVEICPFRDGQQPKLREMILVKWFSGRFVFISETEAGPIRRSAFRSLWFRDVARLRRATA